MKIIESSNRCSSAIRSVVRSFAAAAGSERSVGRVLAEASEAEFERSTIGLGLGRYC